MKSCTIYASAQTFGFGPTALLLSTLYALESKKTKIEKKIYLYGTKNIEILLDGKSHPFHILQKHRYRDELAYLFKVNAFKIYDLFVSFFNPAPIFYSWFYNKTSIFHDGLFDFWDIASFETRLEDDLEYVKMCKKKNDKKALIKWYISTFESNPHQVIFMAHYFATRNYIRNNSVIDDILIHFPQLQQKPLYRVGCIIDPILEKANKKNQKHYLVSLGGSIAPVITFEQNILYAKRMVELVNQMVNSGYYEKLPWYIVCHPKIKQTLEKKKIPLFHGVHLLSSIEMDVFMHKLCEAKAVFVPPGYGTVQEACFCKKPIFFIPEQNAGQPLYFKTLKQLHFPYQYSITLNQDMNKGKLIYKEFDIERMYSDIDILINSSKYESLRKKRIKQFGNLLKNEIMLNQHVEKQYVAMEKMPGGFDGAHVIARGILKEINAKTTL